MRIQNLLEFLFRNERYLFLLFTIANMGPIFMGIFFPSLDGAAHLYNSTLLIHMLMGDEQGVGEFVRINPDPIPNLSGHLFLGILNVFLPGWLSEKLLLVLYLAGLPYAFRSLLKNLGASNPLLSYLIFPFCWSYTFFLGFYNFSLALVLLLATLSFWIRKSTENTFSWKNGLALFGLLLLTYFSHIMVFGILGMLLGLHLITDAALRIFGKASPKETLTYLARRSGILLLAALPSLALAIQYLSKGTGGEQKYLSIETLHEWLLNLRPLIAIDFQREESYTTLFFILLVSLFSLGLLIRIIKTAGEKNKQVIVRLADYFLPSSLLMLILYYTLPDMDYAAGYLSVRLSYFFFLFIAIWIAVQPIGRIGGMICLMVVFITSYGLNRLYMQASQDMGRIASSAYQMRKQVEEGSVVLPVNFNTNFLSVHLSNYLGVEKPMILLENYELAAGYFPLLRNEEEMPVIHLPGSNPGSTNCLEWRSRSQERVREIDYVIVQGEEYVSEDTCRTQIMEQVRTYYLLKDKNDYWSLYQLRP